MGSCVHPNLIRRALSRPITLFLPHYAADFLKLSTAGALVVTLVFASDHGAFADSPASVTWEQQAERLQNVSAALLDAMPVSVVPPNGLSAGAGLALSFLPKVNPRVGGKSEKVPASPVHAVPQIQAAFGQDFVATTVTGRLWGGYLPAGFERVMGVDAQLTQWTVGGAMAATLPLPLPLLSWMGRPAIELGLQASEARLRGAITEPKAKDRFSSSGRILFAAAGLHPQTFGLHAGLLLASRKVASTFVVSSTDTELSLVDESREASLPFAVQGQLGWKFPLGVTVGAAELWVPERLAMPRLFVQYDRVF